MATHDGCSTKCSLRVCREILQQTRWQGLEIEQPLLQLLDLVASQSHGNKSYADQLVVGHGILYFVDAL
jgi:hypothetical protein